MDFKVNECATGMRYTEEEIDLVSEVMRKADTYTQGKHLQKFEKKFEEKVGVKKAFAVANCTNALELAADLCELSSDDEVIIPALTFCATAIPFARTGAKIVWADIDLDTLEISLDSIKRCITKKTKAIVVVHLYGLMCRIDEIVEYAHENGVLVVEDCAQALGASIYEKQAGTFGDFSCFSFHTHKNISTLGEGGMLGVNREDKIKLVKGLRHNGSRPFDYERQFYWKPAMSTLDFDIENVWPHNFCIGEIQCALGTKLLDRVKELNEHRRSRAEKFKELLKDYPELIFQKDPEGYFHAHYLCPARYYDESGKTKNDDLIELLAFKYGVKALVQYYPLYRFPLFIKAGFGNAECPNTDLFYDNMISFPFHEWMSEDDFQYMIDAIKKSIDELRGRK